MYVLDRVDNDDSKDRQLVENVFIRIYPTSSIKDSKFSFIFSIFPPRLTLAKATLHTDLKFSYTTNHQPPTNSFTSRSRIPSRIHYDKSHYHQHQANQHNFTSYVLVT